MGKQKNTEQFIRDAERVHGKGRYDYSLVEYKKSCEPVILICPTHGKFIATPNAHLRGDGCRECARLASRKPIFGVGINDYNGLIKIDGKHLKSYEMWRDLLKRLFSEVSLSREPSYRSVSIDPDWLYYSNFKTWFDASSMYYKSGWQLDKDLLCHALHIKKKIYSPSTCVFLPQEINGALATQPRYRAGLPIGVRRARHGRRYHAVLCSGLKSSKHIGTFDTIEEAFNAYKAAKEEWLKILADKYKSDLDPRAYDALMSYAVDIAD